MLFLKSECLEYIKTEDDIIGIIQVLTLFKHTNNNINIVFNQYYKSLNVKNYVNKVVKVHNLPIYEIESNLLSFIGGLGVLPSHYTERIIASIKKQDTSLLDFVDIFYNQVLQLFSKIVTYFDLSECIKYTQVSRHSRVPNLISVLEKISGKTNTTIQNHLSILNNGMFHVFSKPKLLIESILAQLFQIKVKIKEFIKEKVYLASPYNVLKKGFVLGKKSMLSNVIYVYQNKIDIVLYDLELPKHKNFLDSYPLAVLQHLLKIYLGKSVNYQIKMHFCVPYPSYLKKSHAVLGRLAFCKT